MFWTAVTSNVGIIIAVIALVFALYQDHQAKTPNLKPVGCKFVYSAPPEAGENALAILSVTVHNFGGVAGVVDSFDVPESVPNFLSDLIIEDATIQGFETKTLTRRFSTARVVEHYERKLADRKINVPMEYGLNAIVFTTQTDCKNDFYEANFDSNAKQVITNIPTHIDLSWKDHQLKEETSNLPLYMRGIYKLNH